MPEIKQERVRCEIYSRVVGYLRPIDQWNPGKLAEFKLRHTYDDSIERIDAKIHNSGGT